LTRQEPTAQHPRMTRLVLWDIDRTLLYVGDIDRDIYRAIFIELVGGEPHSYPFRGSGRSLPLAIREYFLANGVAPDAADVLVPRAIELIPDRLAACTSRMQAEGHVYPGAMAALQAVHAMPDTVPTVVTGNVRGSALVKLRAFGMDTYLEPSIGGYSSDNPHRPALVAIAQQRAEARHATAFTRANTVIIGDSLEDVVTGREGGAQVIAVASGAHTAEELAKAGADIVLDSLSDLAAVMAAVRQATPATPPLPRHPASA
jgi:phosphoglycolate phosphatase